MIGGVDLNSEREKWGRRFGMTHFVSASEVGDEIVPSIVKLTKKGADQIGGVKVMRAALECTHQGCGVSVVIGVAPSGAEIQTRPFQLVTGRVWKGTAFGGARWRTDVPRIMDWYMDGKIQIDPMITHRLSLGEINKGFDLMAARIASALCSSNDGGRGADAAAETASSPFAARGSRIARSRIVHWGIPADDLRRC